MIRLVVTAAQMAAFAVANLDEERAAGSLPSNGLVHRTVYLCRYMGCAQNGRRVCGVFFYFYFISSVCLIFFMVELGGWYRRVGLDVSFSWSVWKCRVTFKFLNWRRKFYCFKGRDIVEMCWRFRCKNIFYFLRSWLRFFVLKNYLSILYLLYLGRSARLFPTQTKHRIPIQIIGTSKAQ